MCSFSFSRWFNSFHSHFHLLRKCCARSAMHVPHTPTHLPALGFVWHHRVVVREDKVAHRLSWGPSYHCRVKRNRISLGQNQALRRVRSRPLVDDSPFPSPEPRNFPPADLPTDVPSSTRSRIHQSENVVLHKVASGVGDEVEGLHVAHGLRLIVDHQSTRHQDQDPAGLVGRLRVGRVDPVLDLGEGQVRQLFENGLGSLERFLLKGEHGIVPVESRQLCAVAVKGFVVEVNELLSDALKVSHLDARLCRGCLQDTP